MVTPAEIEVVEDARVRWDDVHDIGCIPGLEVVMAGRRATLLIPLLLLLVYAVALAAYPAIANRVGNALIIVCLGLALLFIIQNNWHAFTLGRISGSKFVRNILLDVLGLLLTITAASYLGRLAGNWLGVSFGGWIGVITGLGIAFVVSWSVWRTWGRVSWILTG
ncbi:MAG: hypothetical protein FJZ87_11965 [Chloroflexi bacterium]|nr:hypothetical protein [Chloroflexota bacterium]